MLEHPLPDPKQGQEEDTLKRELQRIAVFNLHEDREERQNLIDQHPDVASKLNFNSS